MRGVQNTCGQGFCILVADGMTEEEKLTAEEWARRGGDARSKSLTAKRRKEIAKKAAEARWGKKPEKPEAKKKS
jgi:hypothetical protein